jgi:adenylate cyclase class 1
MGSAGTIAQSRRSDLDVWLCHRNGLSAEGLALLQGKCTRISEWAASVGLEVHFFMMQAETFRTGGAEDLSSESSGSTQHHLLLDEFYRTALLVGGRAPLWWVVPPDFEDEYDSFVETLSKHRFVKPQEYLDFGPVASIEAAEFFGATLWQLSKTVSAPHKSLLKILLLEAYAGDHPKVDLLSMRFKRAVYDGEKAIDALEPYVLLLGKVEEHLTGMHDEDRLALARRSFYFKVNHPLSKRFGSHRNDWRGEVVAEHARAWGWDDAYLEELDERPRWKIDRTLRERRSLVAALRRTYKSLSRFAREHAEDAMVSERDMTILGRKLFTVFEHKAGKIDLVNHAISGDLSERQLAIQRVNAPDTQPYWLLFRGNAPSRDVSPAAAVKRGWSALELLAWSYFNGLMTPNTRVIVAARDQRLAPRDTAAVNEHLHRHLPPALTRIDDLDDFTRMPTLTAAALFVNLGVDPLSSYTRKGNSLATSRADALSYSGWHENLVQEIDYLVVTSWREVLTFKYQGVEGLMACLCEHLRWAARTDASRPPQPSCCEPRHGVTITRRVSSLFEHLTTWFTTGLEERRRRYVLRVGRSYQVLLAAGDTPSHEFSGSWQELLQHLGRPNQVPTPVTFDAGALDDELLAHVYETNLPGDVQFFFRELDKEAQILVTDENGSLFMDQVPFYSQQSLVQQFAQFFDAVQLRQSSSGQLPLVDKSLSTATFTEALRQLNESHVDQGGPSLRSYRVTKPRGSDYRIEEVPYERPSRTSSYIEVQVIGDTVNGEATFTLYCDGHEFSTQEYGAAVFERVTEYVVGRRRGQRPYPVYITDIDLSRLPVEGAIEGRLHTIHYLQYKRRIEHRLNEAVARQFAEEPSPAGAAVGTG